MIAKASYQIMFLEVVEANSIFHIHKMHDPATTHTYILWGSQRSIVFVFSDILKDDSFESL